MASIPTIGIAILGAGIFPKEAYLPALAAIGDKAPTLRAVYSRSEKSANELAEAAKTKLKLSDAPAIYHDGGTDNSANLDALLARSDIAAVIIALPITRQPEVILKCLEAGKHVLSEKPVAADVQSGIDLIERYQSSFAQKGLVWRVAENFEAEPGFRAAAAAIAAGKIGKIIFFKAVVVNYVDQDSKWYKTPWRTIPDYQGGFLLDGGVHTIAALRIILPHPLTHLSGFASLNKDYLLPHDTIHFVARAGDDFHGLVEMTFASPTKTRPVADQFVFTGTDGWLSINSSTPPGSTTPVLRIVIKSMVKVDGQSNEEKEEIVEEQMHGVQYEFEHFFDAIAGNLGPALDMGDPWGALRDVAVIQAALNSQGNMVDLAQMVPGSR